MGLPSVPLAFAVEAISLLVLVVFRVLIAVVVVVIVIVVVVIEVHVAADMCWSAFTKSSAGVCERYALQCYTHKSSRLICPSCEITLCVLKIDGIKTAACPCKKV